MRPVSMRDETFEWPIYVGKAVPAGARRGGMVLENYKGKALFKRLNEHAKSIEQASNLDVRDFTVAIWSSMTFGFHLENRY